MVETGCSRSLFEPRRPPRLVGSRGGSPDRSGAESGSCLPGGRKLQTGLAGCSPPRSQHSLSSPRPDSAGRAGGTDQGRLPSATRSRQARIVQPERLSWSAQLGAWLNEDPERSDVEVVGFGVGGATLPGEGRPADPGDEGLHGRTREGVRPLGRHARDRTTVQAGRGNWEKADDFVGDPRALRGRARAKPGGDGWIVGPPPMFADARGLDDASGLADRSGPAPDRAREAREGLRRGDAGRRAHLAGRGAHRAAHGRRRASRSLRPRGHLARAVHSRLAAAMGREVAALAHAPARSVGGVPRGRRLGRDLVGRLVLSRPSRSHSTSSPRSSSSATPSPRG